MMKQMKNPEPIEIPAEIAARYTNPDQAERFDGAVRKVFGLSPERAAQIRNEADQIRNPKGRQPGGKISASRVPVSVNLA
jgi:hypothetical protein